MFLLEFSSFVSQIGDKVTVFISITQEKRDFFCIIQINFVILHPNLIQEHKKHGVKRDNNH